MTRILHLYAGNLYGGVESYLVTLAKVRHLAPHAEPHFGLCFPGRLRDELSAAGATVHDLGAVRVRQPWTILKARQRLKKLLREVEYAAVVTHSCWPHAVFAPVVRRAGVRLVNATHDVLAGRHWLDRWAARMPPDMVIANSRFTAGPAARLFTQSPVEVCYLPVAARLSTERESVRAALKTPPGAVVILQASRLERWKGQAVHLQALAMLKGVPGWEAWFAGGPQKAGESEFDTELKTFARQAGIADRVQFLGQRSDVPALMASADIYCQPNTVPEAFGVAFIEALSAGLPVVASDAGGPAEIVTPDCGILCPPGDAGAVSRALGRLIEDSELRTALGPAGPAQAAQLCDPARQMTRLAELTTGTTPHARNG